MCCASQKICYPASARFFASYPIICKKMAVTQEPLTRRRSLQLLFATVPCCWNCLTFLSHSLYHGVYYHCNSGLLEVLAYTSHEKVVMFVTQVMPPGSPWRGSLRDLTQIVNDIRRLRAFGRLTLRSTTHIGLAHLFFRAGNLVHIVSNSGEASATPADLPHSTPTAVRFERGIPEGKQNVSSDHARIF